MTGLTRRATLSGSAIVAALSAAGIMPTKGALAAWNRSAFEGRSLVEALAALGIAAPAASGEVQIVANEFADNGAAVPVQVVSALPRTTRIVLLVDRNPNVLSAVFALGPMAVPEVSTRIKMAQTSNVVAVVEADGRFFAAQREIKITIGGCVG